MNPIECVTEATGNSGNRLELWKNILSWLGAKSICEVGVYGGKFAAHILETCAGIEKYVMIDPWRHLDNWNKQANKGDAAFEKIYRKAMSRTDEFADKRVVLRDTTKDAAPRIEDGSLDAVYVDGDHTLRGITMDLHLMLPKVRIGGVIGGDDFTSNIWQHNERFSPSEVFPYALCFAEANNLQIVTLPFNQFCIVNRPDDGFKLIDLAGYGQLTPVEIYFPDYAVKRSRRKRRKFWSKLARAWK